MKTTTTTLVIAAFAIAATACTTRPVQPQFTQIAIDTLLGNDSMDCRVEYNFATITNAGSSSALEAIEQANINYFFELEDFEGTATEAAAEALFQITAELKPLEALPTDVPAAWRHGEISAESEGMVIDTMVSYVIVRASYTGGAHGIYGTECHTYSLAGGYELTTADLFGEERMASISVLIRTKLYEQNEVNDDKGLSEKGFFPEYIAITENFRITNEGITFIYNPYEIGCYALGDVQVEISHEELKRM